MTSCVAKYDYSKHIPTYKEEVRAPIVTIRWSGRDHKETIEEFKVWRFNKKPLPIEGTSFSLPYELHNLAKAIDRSKKLLTLKDNWDEEGALATNIETYNKAIKFLVEYSIYILNSGPGQVVLDAPDIDILNDGSIVINWETKSATFTIIFDKSPTDIAYFYAKEYSEGSVPLKHGINLTKKIDKYTAEWMSNNLK